MCLSSNQLELYEIVVPRITREQWYRPCFDRERRIATRQGTDSAEFLKYHSIQGKASVVGPGCNDQCVRRHDFLDAKDWSSCRDQHLKPWYLSSVTVYGPMPCQLRCKVCTWCHVSKLICEKWYRLAIFTKYPRPSLVFALYTCPDPPMARGCLENRRGSSKVREWPTGYLPDRFIMLTWARIMGDVDVEQWGQRQMSEMIVNQDMKRPQHLLVSSTWEWSIFKESRKNFKLCSETASLCLLSTHSVVWWSCCYYLYFVPTLGKVPNVLYKEVS